AGFAGAVAVRTGERSIHQRAVSAQRSEALAGACAGCGIDELQGLSGREVDVADQNEQGQQGQTAEIQGTVQSKPQGGGQQGQPAEPKREEEVPEKKSNRRIIVI